MSFDANNSSCVTTFEETCGLMQGLRGILLKAALPRTLKSLLHNVVEVAAGESQNEAASLDT